MGLNKCRTSMTRLIFNNYMSRTIAVQSFQERLLLCIVTFKKAQHVFGCTMHGNLRLGGASVIFKPDRCHTHGPTNARMVIIVRSLSNLYIVVIIGCGKNCNLNNVRKII